MPRMKQVECAGYGDHALRFKAQSGSLFDQIFSGDNLSQALTYARGKRPKLWGSAILASAAALEYALRLHYIFCHKGSLAKSPKESGV